MSTSLINKERFIPSRLSNLAVWLDGADPSTILQGGGYITKWKDKSKNENDFFTGVIPPVIPFPTITVNFNNPTSEFYTVPTSSYNYSVYVVVKGAGGGRCQFGGGGGNGGYAAYTFNNVPPTTSILVGVGAKGDFGPFSTPAGGGQASSVTISSLTITAGGGGGGGSPDDDYPPGGSGTGGYGGGGGRTGGGGPGTAGANELVSGLVVTTGGGADGNTDGSVMIILTPLAESQSVIYENPGVFFPARNYAVCSKLSSLAKSKTMIAVYRCSNSACSINIGLGPATNVNPPLFGICQTGGNTLYSPYLPLPGNLTFTPTNYTAINYAFASYDASQYTLTGMSGFNNLSLKAVTLNGTMTEDAGIVIGTTTGVYTSSNFTLYELIATSNALTSSDRQDVEGYLAAKWGLSAQLPSFHPYKNFEPSGDQWIPPTLPTAISGLVSWLDMTYPGQTNTNIVDRISGSFTVNVGSGNQFQLSNINNLPSLYFPGNSSNYLYKTSLPPTAEGSVLFVFNITDTRSDMPILAWRASSGTAPWGPLLTYSGGQTLTLQNNYAGTTGSDITPVTLPMATGTNLVFFAWDKTNFYLSVNGGIPVVRSNAIPGSATTMYIGTNLGGSNSPTMNFGELVVYNQYFEQSERQLLEGYLAWKRSIMSKLPNDHPFSKESPIGATVSETGALNIPAQIASLTTWLDAADSATIILKDGLLVQQWYDKSATSDIFTGDNFPAYTNTPPGSPSSPGVYFSGFNFLRGTVDAAIGSGVGTCFMVATIGNNVQVFMGGYVSKTPKNGDSFGLMSVDKSITSPIQGVDRVNRNPLPGTLTLNTTPTVLFARINATINPPTGDGSYGFATPVNQTEIIRGTETLLQPSVPSQSPWNLGYIETNPAPQDSYIHEFLCFSDSFTDSQRFVVEGYLAWKWGIQSQLPVGHLYKNARPQSA